MIITQINPSIDTIEINNTEYLRFKFKGNLTENNATDAIKYWKELVENSNSRRSYIWDCSEMTGYEPMARVQWQGALQEQQSLIDKIWLITDSILIKTGAKMISLFTSYEINIVKSQNDIYLVA